MKNIRIDETKIPEAMEIKDFQRYWSYTSLETMARKALMAPPARNNVTDEQIKEIVLGILKHHCKRLSKAGEFL